ncbi:hypothetical protein OG21DRAFT_1522434 [Imleria badia]|nr:hypothetical protein OG21DRAFT_1522434 [Imleria badia]
MIKTREGNHLDTAPDWYHYTGQHCKATDRVLFPLYEMAIENAAPTEPQIAADLRSILETWPGGPKPKAFYTVPYGCNPTGMTATIERRRDVLQLAREYNFLILEGCAIDWNLRDLNFSEILSAGTSMGFASGPNSIIDVMDHHVTVWSCLLTGHHWSRNGDITAFHTDRGCGRVLQRDTFEKALQTHLGDLAEWKTLAAGMFFWFKLLVNADPNEECDSTELIQTKAYENGVVALPGTVFLPNGRKTAYIRESGVLSFHGVTS